VFHLPALGACVGEARRRLRALLVEQNVDGEARDDAGLVISELFTNAIRHSDSERISCAVRVTGNLLRLEVADQGCGLTEPQSREPGVDEECGRGLQLVNAVALAWGVQACPDGRGRLVWAVLRHRGGA
jgi:serine/threonine-protein kinase RsbW